MNKCGMIIVGGFLGAGKTSLLWSAASSLSAMGHKVGLMTNDQAPQLVDIKFLKGSGLAVGELSGSCFCCNFTGFYKIAKTLKDDSSCDLVLAEPVGSCTDLSATIIQPLKRLHSNDYSLSPLSGLVDPFRLKELLAGFDSLHPSSGYILLKQLEEADCIVVNKIDLLDATMRTELGALLASHFPGRPVFWVSAKTGEGVDGWLAHVLNSNHSGLRIADVDYDIYAEGEAVLGWLNASVSLRSGDGASRDWAAVAKRILGSLREEFRAGRNRVGHVKILLSDESGSNLRGNFTRLEEEPSFLGCIRPSSGAELIVNARVESSPEDLEKAVRNSLKALSPDLAVELGELSCLSPGRPNPTHRYSSVS